MMITKNKLSLAVVSVCLTACAEPPVDEPLTIDTRTNVTRHHEINISASNHVIQQPATYTAETLTTNNISASSSSNYPPDLKNEVFYITQNQVLNNISLLANDSDKNGDKLTIINFTQGQNGGKVSQLQADIFSYTPPANYTGSDSFSYLVTDGFGGSLWAKADVVISNATVTTNQTLVAKADTFNVLPGSFTILNLIQNDTINTSSNYAAFATSYPSHGNLWNISNGVLQYRPASNFIGQDTFTYQLQDAAQNISTASVTINVLCPTNCSQLFELSWQPSPSQGVVAYRLHVGKQSRLYTEVYETNALTQFQFTAKEKGNYYFAVSAINNQSVESPLSDEVWAQF